MKIHEAMTRAVQTVAVDTSLKDAAAQMARSSISGMPVVDDAGHVVGVISEADVLVKEAKERQQGGILHWLVDPDPAWASRADATTVGEAMSAPAITITPRHSIAEAATIMLDEGINRLPVVDETGELVGLLSRGDLVKAFARTDDEIRREIEQDVIHHALWLDGSSVQVTVDEGVVRLTGEVESAAEVDLVGAFVRRVPGVVSVDSKLTHRG